LLDGVYPKPSSELAEAEKSDGHIQKDGSELLTAQNPQNWITGVQMKEKLQWG
jgi:hypothetical protein